MRTGHEVIGRVNSIIAWMSRGYEENGPVEFKLNGLAVCRYLSCASSYSSIPWLRTDWPLAVDAALVLGRILSQGAVRYGTSLSVDILTSRLVTFYCTMM